VAAIVPPVASAETEPVSRVVDAVDGAVVVAAVVVVARVTALWARRVTAAPKAVAATERLARESPAGKNASTRIRHSVVKDKVTVAASRWQTATIISTSTTVTTTTRTRITRTDRLKPASSAIRAGRIRADSEMRRQTAGLSRPSAPRSKAASRRSPVNRASLVSHANLGKTANLGKLVNPGKTVNLGKLANPGSLASHAQSSTNRNSMRARSSASHSNTIRSLVKARVRRSSHPSISIRRPPRPVRHDPLNRLLFGPRPRQAINATSKVS
jgi:hypothetical protein